ncbi:MAG: hypothetical protein GX890_08935 [Firmicutes bacterium]|jgi:hypothetical protein|nr:hypothetical protein [Bacillota bacterium]HPU00908.1 hypothetical protein [Bacillota bacterium]
MKKLLAAAIILAMWLIMMPLGSFLLDPGLLILIGLLIVYIARRLLGQQVKEQIFIPLLAAVTLVIFYWGSLSLYFNQPYVDFLHRFAALFPLIGESPSGFNFMLCSGIFNCPYITPQEAPFYVHLAGGFIFATYPLWLYLGIRLGCRLMPHSYS